MNNILKRRVALIRAMQSATVVLTSYMTTQGYMRDSVNNSENYLKNVIRKIREDKLNHFLAVSNESIQKVSYANHKQNKLEESKRTNTTLRRYICRNFDDDSEINDYYIDGDMFNKFAIFTVLELCKSKKQISDLNSRVKLLSGDDIQKHYSNTVITSCMTTPNNDLVAMYCLNPDKVQLAVLDEVVRALLWTCDDGTKVLDRAYPANCDAIMLLREWAVNNGYVLRAVSDKSVISTIPIELSDNKFHEITLKHNNIFPYLDTFRFADIAEGDIIKLSNDKDFGWYVLTNCEGYFNYKHKCNYCGDPFMCKTDTIYKIMDYEKLCLNCYNSLVLK